MMRSQWDDVIGVLGAAVICIVLGVFARWVFGVYRTSKVKECEQKALVLDAVAVRHIHHYGCFVKVHRGDPWRHPVWVERAGRYELELLPAGQTS